MLVATLLLAATPVSPTDSRIVYVGRWDMSEKAAPGCQWPASEVRFRFEGPGALTVTTDESDHDLWQVVLDGKPTQVLALEKGIHTYEISLPPGLHDTRPTIHQVRFVRRTEAFFGTTRFRGFSLSGTLLRDEMPIRRHIEVVGDSITCGYGNEGLNQNDKFKAETENAYMSYASVAARAVKADVDIIAWSGRKMWPNNTMPEIYDRILPTQDTPVYDFRGPAPSAVIINLATNDFGPGNPDEAKWTGAYEQFIRRVWSHYPKALIYCATGSMMSDGYPPKQRALSILVSYLQNMIARMNDPRVHLLQFDTQRQEDGLGSDWHPSVKTDEKMGAKLAEALRHDLGW